MKAERPKEAKQAVDLEGGVERDASGKVKPCTGMHGHGRCRRNSVRHTPECGELERASARRN